MIIILCFDKDTEAILDLFKMWLQIQKENKVSSNLCTTISFSASIFVLTIAVSFRKRWTKANRALRRLQLTTATQWSITGQRTKPETERRVQGTRQKNAIKNWTGRNYTRRIQSYIHQKGEWKSLKGFRRVHSTKQRQGKPVSDQS